MKAPVGKANSMLGDAGGVGEVGDTSWFASASGARRSLRIARIGQSTEPKVDYEGDGG